MESKTFEFNGDSLPAGLHVSDTQIGAPPGLLQRKHDQQNVVVKDGFLHLTVPGRQHGRDPLSCAEVRTAFKVRYGSVKTYAILTETPGICNGMFMYHDDNQETDIEWLSDARAAPNGGRKLHFVNQPLRPGSGESHFVAEAPVDATFAVHEYRLDWTPGGTACYVDGRLLQRFTNNVPTEAGQWMWNAWTNGNPGWAGGPPVEDAVFKIQKIVMDYYPG
ncbi:hypothetical protein MBLNU230_g8367t1 [Neophaeotheca triangularis]